MILSCIAVRWFNVRFCTFTGEKLVDFLHEPKKGTKWPNKMPRFDSRQEAILVCKTLCKDQFIVRAEKVAKGELEVCSD